MWLKQIFFKKSSRMLILATCYTSMQSYFKIFNTFPFLYKFESLGFQMQATDKGGRVGHQTHTVKQAK